MKTHTTIFGICALLLFAVSSAKAQTCAGCLDPTFGSGGTQYITGMGTGQTVLNDMIIQADGKIVSVITNGTSQTMPGATLIRLNPDGSRDTSFDGDGIVETNWHYNSTLPRGYAYALASQFVNGEERLVVAGSWSVQATRNTQTTMLRVDRYLSNGAIDTSFGPNGTGTVLINKPYALAVAIQPTDNKIITVGDGQAVVRLNVNGTIDTGFGQNSDGATGAGQSGWAIKGLPDGSIIIGGTYSYNLGDLLCVSRLNANGSVNTTFGSSGRAIANFYGRGSFGRAFRVDVDPLGNIVAGGIARPKNGSFDSDNFAVARFTSTGQLDTSFNGTGMALYDFAGLGDTARSVVAQADGKLILTGSAKMSTADSADFAAIRFNFDGTIDTSFGTNGRVTQNIDRSDYSYSSRLWIDPSCGCEKLIMAGESYSGVSFARYLTQ